MYQNKADRRIPNHWEKLRPDQLEILESTDGKPLQRTNTRISIT